MTHQLFPTPSIVPLQRLHVYDSLMMNADRWHLAQTYQRRRQNVHYQSLNQPGIVCGLGICLIEPPESADVRFRDRRWIEIQPGIAIDLEGNVIVVDATIDRRFRIAVKSPSSGSLTVYVVVSYREPEALDSHQHLETLTEQFRFDQKTDPPAPHEVELCRIQLKPGIVELANPINVLLPQANQLDLRYRVQAQSRPQAIVSMAQVKPHYLGQENDRTPENLSFLMQSVASLYPALKGISEIQQVALTSSDPLTPDVLYLTDSQAIGLDDHELERLQQYLETGGVLLVEAATDSQITIDDVINLLSDSLETSLQRQTANRDCPLRISPFLFAALPSTETPIQLWQGGGIILVQGDLSASWGLNDSLDRSRNDLRSAQEFGVNILHFAWNRRRLTQLLSIAEH